MTRFHWLKNIFLVCSYHCLYPQHCWDFPFKNLKFLAAVIFQTFYSLSVSRRFFEARWVTACCKSLTFPQSTRCPVRCLDWSQWSLKWKNIAWLNKEQSNYFTTWRLHIYLRYKIWTWYIFIPTLYIYPLSGSSSTDK